MKIPNTTVIEMRDKLNELIEQGCSNDWLVIKASDSGLCKVYEVNKGTIVLETIIHPREVFISDESVEYDNDCKDDKYYEFCDYEKNVKENMLSRAVALAVYSI